METNLLDFTDYLVNAMDKRLQVDVVYTDFSKAFDKINHDMLIEKLWRIGVHGDLLRWINSYIKNRSQAVFLKGYTSSFLEIPSGIPQGSPDVILGEYQICYLFFILMTSEISLKNRIFFYMQMTPSSLGLFLEWTAVYSYSPISMGSLVIAL